MKKGLSRLKTRQPYKTVKAGATMTKILGSSLPNIPWEDRPAGYKLPVWRYSGNPIIGRDGNRRSNSVFNSAVVPYKGGFAGLFPLRQPLREHGPLRRLQ